MKFLNLTTLLFTGMFTSSVIAATAVDDINENIIINDNKATSAKLINVSYYSSKHHGRKTANGERFNMYDYTAAHKTLPFNTKLKITCQETGKSIVVRVNDRGPFIKGRSLDLSYAAAKSLGIISKGVAKVRMEIIK